MEQQSKYFTNLMGYSAYVFPQFHNALNNNCSSEDYDIIPIFEYRSYKRNMSEVMNVEKDKGKEDDDSLLTSVEDGRVFAELRLND